MNMSKYFALKRVTYKTCLVFCDSLRDFFADTFNESNTVDLSKLEQVIFFAYNWEVK